MGGSWWLRVSITSFGTSCGLLLQYFQQWQSPSQQWCLLLVAESKYYFFQNLLCIAAPVFESAVPTDRRSDSLDIDCFADNWQSFLKNKKKNVLLNGLLFSSCHVCEQCRHPGTMPFY